MLASSKLMKIGTKKASGVLTDSCEDIGEAKVIDGIEREEVIEELLLLVITAQEGIALVQLSVREEAIHQSPSQEERKEARITQFWKEPLGEE